MLPPEECFQQVSRRLDKIPDISRRTKEDIRDRIARELMSAAQVQKNMLPQELPSTPGYSFWAMQEQFADAMGGDLYDFQTLPTGEILVLVSDVSGKGITASVAMAALAGIITVAIETFGGDLDGMMKAINRAYCRRMQHSDSYATLVAVALDPVGHKLRTVNAGHGPGLIRRNDGSIEQVAQASGLPLGISDEAEYLTVIIEIAPGDVVFIATDGVSDAFDGEAEVYGMDRPSKVLARTIGGAAEIGQTVLADVKTFISGRSLFDDTTIVCFSRDVADRGPV